MAARRFGTARWVWLCLAVVLTTLVVVSPWWYVGIERPTWSLALGNGHARVWWLRAGQRYPGGRQMVTVDIREYHERPRLWFGRTSNPLVPSVWVPLWAVMLMPVWGVTGLVWWFGPPLPRRGRCHGCGYSLHGLAATAEGVRCPECGACRRMGVLEGRILGGNDYPREDADQSPDEHPDRAG